MGMSLNENKHAYLDGQFAGPLLV